MRPFHLLLLAASLAACAPTVRPGKLNPVNSRITNEVVAADLNTLDTWRHRAALLQAAVLAVRPSPSRAYAVAKAQAWLDYARDSYAVDPRDGTADVAFAEGRRLVLALEAGETPVEPSPTLGPRLRPDLWGTLDTLVRSVDNNGRSGLALAQAELALVRAERLAMGDVTGRPGVTTAAAMADAAERRCRMQFEEARAERLLNALRPRPALPTPPSFRTAAAPPPASSTPAREQLRSVVHFALNSADLSAQSRAVLDQVVAVLRAHPKVGVAIEGYADPRGGADYNRELAARRGIAVRDYLTNARLDLGRVTVVAVGSSATYAATTPSSQKFARDRRVTLTFVDADGRPLSGAGLAALSNLEGRDLQVESAVRPPRPARRMAKPPRPSSENLRRGRSSSAVSPRD